MTAFMVAVAYVLIWRICVLACGLVAIVLGIGSSSWAFPPSRGELEAGVAGSSLKVRNMAPGTFFALFGAAIIAALVWSSPSEIVVPKEALPATGQVDQSSSGLEGARAVNGAAGPRRPAPPARGGHGGRPGLRGELRRRGRRRRLRGPRSLPALQRRDGRPRRGALLPRPALPGHGPDRGRGRDQARGAGGGAGHRRAHHRSRSVRLLLRRPRQGAAAGRRRRRVSGRAGRAGSQRPRVAHLHR